MEKLKSVLAGLEKDPYDSQNVMYPMVNFILNLLEFDASSLTADEKKMLVSKGVSICGEVSMELYKKYSEEEKYEVYKSFLNLVNPVYHQIQNKVVSYETRNCDLALLTADLKKRIDTIG